MVKARKFVYHSPFDGLPKETDLKLVEEELPPLRDGEFLTKAVFLSVDPYMRSRAPGVDLGATYIGSQVAKVIESKNPEHPVGEHLVGRFGWRTHTICDSNSDFWLVPDLEGLPLSYSLGVLGMPGNTAYFGFLEICQPKPGQTVVVTGAGGAVGSIVGQIARIKGCTVIAIAGSEEKGKWLIGDLKFDHFLNYKDVDFETKLEGVTPNGVDCYFDNVGGEIASIVLTRMNEFGRISVCGAVSGYNNDFSIKASPIQYLMIRKQLKMEGFNVYRWQERWFEGISQNMKWIQEGKLQYRETLTEGFHNMVKAFIAMLEGRNVGKAVVKA
ncbi:prostaglandin reductase 1-like [Tribolium madens]|uniref:prostaglandin reductase 1-like n=1 Tax=Tribolium madens TaxID=41895 RepID=UPI001CF72EC0|nr:prostaglandin reductase 1-like [Tribolium madens]